MMEYSVVLKNCFGVTKYCEQLTEVRFCQERCRRNTNDHMTLYLGGEIQTESPQNVPRHRKRKCKATKVRNDEKNGVKWAGASRDLKWRLIRLSCYGCNRRILFNVVVETNRWLCTRSRKAAMHRHVQDYSHEPCSFDSCRHCSCWSWELRLFLFHSFHFFTDCGTIVTFFLRIQFYKSDHFKSVFLFNDCSLGIRRWQSTNTSSIYAMPKT